MLLHTHPPCPLCPTEHITPLSNRPHLGIPVSQRDPKPFVQNSHFGDRAPCLLFQRSINSRLDVATAGGFCGSVPFM